MQVEPTPRNYVGFFGVIYKIIIPRDCQQQYIPVLSEESRLKLDLYFNNYEEALFSTKTVKFVFHKLTFFPAGLLLTRYSFLIFLLIEVEILKKFLSFTFRFYLNIIGDTRTIYVLAGCNYYSRFPL